MCALLTVFDVYVCAHSSGVHLISMGICLLNLSYIRVAAAVLIATLKQRKFTRDSDSAKSPLKNSPHVLLLSAILVSIFVVYTDIALQKADFSSTWCV